jgi:hypothetical protein
MTRRLLPAVCLLAAFLRPAAAEDFPPPSLPDTSDWGRNIQRTMRLLAESTPQKRNTVRILFYGQSITEQKWAKIVADDLKKRFPHANLIIENRALGGYASQLLVKTAETDLYPFQPDLVIFHVYGAHNTYEDILRRTRERTTAEILQQNDHCNRPEDLTEPTDISKEPFGKPNWGTFMNQKWLPSLARKYGTEFCDQRALWKKYLADHKLEPKTLLKDGVHLNAHGEYLMAECVKAYLRYDPKLGPSPAEQWVTTYEVGKDVNWVDGKLKLAFGGNRVDVVCKAGTGAPAAVRNDGKKPGEHPGAYAFTRALGKPGSKWPLVAELSWEKTPLVEDWTMEVRKVAGKDKTYAFTLTGSKTGPDGEGTSETRFVSKSGRVVIDPADWGVEFALALGGIKPPPEKFTVRWKVVPQHVDEFVSPGVPDPAVETTVTLAQGLENTNHVLEITGGPDTPIRAIRVYQPPLGRK